MGYIPSRRRCPTGIGYTLETLSGVAENNDASPDITALN
ncbi:MAG: MvaI/BcnI family restriction endonuclease [Treponema sp.]|nr:MvaI/BcnI family restriction endonuclease [Treponema sp.]